jgi:hypothetical protein
MVQAASIRAWLGLCFAAKGARYGQNCGPPLTRA